MAPNGRCCRHSAAKAVDVVLPSIPGQHPQYSASGSFSSCLRAVLSQRRSATPCGRSGGTPTVAPPCSLHISHTCCTVCTLLLLVRRNATPCGRCGETLPVASPCCFYMSHIPFLHTVLLSYTMLFVLLFLVLRSETPCGKSVRRQACWLSSQPFSIGDLARTRWSDSSWSSGRPQAQPSQV